MVSLAVTNSVSIDSSSKMMSESGIDDMMASLASSVNESQHNKKANRFAVRM
jgi:hypothetical protein